jgi:hypothetical protein
MTSEPVKFKNLQPRDAPKSGVYVFSEGPLPLYVGRSRRIRGRLRFHCFGTPNQSVFAFKLARERTGNIKATYSPKGSRKALMTDPKFVRAFESAKARIREMDIRFIEESDPVGQALLEIYVSLALDTPYNDFDTH